MTLQDSNGNPLQAKEGVILGAECAVGSGAEGRTPIQPQGFAQRSFAFSLSRGSGLGALILLPVIVALGLFFFTGFAALLFLIFAISSIVRALSKPRRGH